MTTDLQQRLAVVFGFGENFESKSLEDEMEFKVRHVRTPAGVRRFKLPIGSVIGSGGKKFDGFKEVASDFNGWNKYQGKDKKHYYVGKDAGDWVVADPDDNVLHAGKSEDSVLEWLNDKQGGGKSNVGAGSSSGGGKAKKPVTSDHTPEQRAEYDDLTRNAQQVYRSKRGAGASHEAAMDVAVNGEKEWDDDLNTRQIQAVRGLDTIVRDYYFDLREHTDHTDALKLAKQFDKAWSDDEVQGIATPKDHRAFARAVRSGDTGKALTILSDLKAKTNAKKQKSVDGLDLFRQAINPDQISLLTKTNMAVEAKDFDSARRYATLLLNDARANGMRDGGVDEVQNFIDQI